MEESSVGPAANTCRRDGERANERVQGHFTNLIFEKIVINALATNDENIFYC